MATEKERLDEIEPKVTDLIAIARTLVAELNRVSERLGVLERRLAGIGAGVDAQLDTVEGTELSEIVAALRAAWDAEQELLADPVRAELNKEVTEFAEIKLQREKCVAKLKAGRLRIPRIERDALEHEIHHLEWKLNAQEAAASQAEDRLAADERAMEEPWRRDAVLAGEKARSEIVAAVRQRLDRSIAADERLPVWFRIAMGSIVSPDPTEWLDTAVELIAYRLEYNITDLVRPMGDPPVADQGCVAWVRRLEVYDRISRRLENLRP